MRQKTFCPTEQQQQQQQQQQHNNNNNNSNNNSNNNNHNMDETKVPLYWGLSYTTAD
jgi:hypothetical protein